MKKEHIAVFEELLKDETFKGKKALNHLLWLNTSKPEIEIGSCYKVTDKGHYLFGIPIRDFNAKVVEISSTQMKEEWQYILEVVATYKDATLTTKVWKYENELKRCEKCEDNINTLTKVRDDYA